MRRPRPRIASSTTTTTHPCNKNNNTNNNNNNDDDNDNNHHNHNHIINSQVSIVVVSIGANVSSGVFTVRARYIDLTDTNNTWWSIVVDDLVQDFDYYEIPIFVLLGSLGGLVGALFNYVNGGQK